jgi:hypothetical protein
VIARGNSAASVEHTAPPISLVLQLLELLKLIESRIWLFSKARVIMAGRSRLGKRERHQSQASIETLCFAIDPDSGEVKPQAPLEFDPAFGAAPPKQARARVGGTLEALVAAWSPAAVLHLTNCRVADGDKIVWKDVWLQ